MIKLLSKADCVGCGGCAQRCPAGCIAMQADTQGFLYPKIDSAKCIDCGLCERVCPVINQGQTREPMQSFCAWHDDESIRKASSSGGIFTALAQHIIDKGGVVFGARFDGQMDVCHDFAENMDAVAAFRGSKYVQSKIGNTYIQAEKFLKDGRWVLYSGSPCQIAGLKRFLRKEYKNLLTVDVACHSVPSPKVWQAYLASIGVGGIRSINFRDKRCGWRSYGVVIQGAQGEASYQRAGVNAYMQGFLKDLYSRPSCFECPAKCGKSGSDFTLADFWGVWEELPNVDDSMGVSAVMCNTDHAVAILKELSCIKLVEVKYDDIVKHNGALVHSAIRPKESDLFWAKFMSQSIECIPHIIRKMQPSFVSRVIGFLKRKLK